MFTGVEVNVPAFCLQEVTPWDVKGGADGKIDYDKLSRDVSAILCATICTFRVARY